MLSWFTTRVFMFPLFVIHSTLFESMVGGAGAGQRLAHRLQGLGCQHAGGLARGADRPQACWDASMPLLPTPPPNPAQERARQLGVADSIQPHHTILNAFLIFLYCLHVYWCAARGCMCRCAMACCGAH